MSGHSKWAKVKYQKAVNDPKKGKAFSKLSALISIAARDGKDIETNSKLRVAVEKAKELGMPKDNIEKAIKRGAGELKEEKNLEELFCEAYGPGGSALLIHAITDNKNRTLAELRHLLQTYESKMAETGSVRWMFKEVGVIFFPKTNWNDDFSLKIIEKGAEEIKEKEEEIIVYTSPQNLLPLKKFIEELLPDTQITAEFDFISQQPLILSEADKTQIEKLFEALEDHSDIEGVYSNVE
ncbi:MAG: YebC/PmpR family DNA-binding transcriptional regulator [Candidatus Pacebacteria bacterium]|nr:YebC/PmpR family DNA-binding transcriptional regulator [Candidatus Paceibacterota bacterium]